MVVVYVFAGVVSLIGAAVWIGLLIWAAKGDGEVQTTLQQSVDLLERLRGGA